MIHRLRLRDMRPSDGGAPLLRLGRKADVDARTRPVTSIYLPEEEYAVLAFALKASASPRRVIACTRPLGRS